MTLWTAWAIRLASIELFPSSVVLQEVDHTLKQIWNALKVWAISTIALFLVALFVANAVKDTMTKGLKEQIEIIKAQNKISIDDRAELREHMRKNQESIDRIEKAVGK